MTPEQLAKSGTEAAHQTALFAWAACAALRGFDAAREFCRTGEYPKVELEELFPAGFKGVPELRWLHHIPNGGSRGDSAQSRAIRGGQLKAQGVRVGVSDVSLPVKRGPWSGLYIEMKKPDERPKREGSKGGVSDEQAEFGEFVKLQGFGFVVCYSWEEAAAIIEQYLTYV